MKKMIIGIMIGVIISGTVGVLASTIISSTNVTYQNKTVNNALDELYNEAVTGKELVAAAITNKGISTTSNDTYETMATNINNIDTNHTELNQKMNSLESKHNSDIASITGSISSINQIVLYKTTPAATETYVTQNLKLYKQNHMAFLAGQIIMNATVSGNSTMVFSVDPECESYLFKNHLIWIPIIGISTDGKLYPFYMRQYRGVYFIDGVTYPAGTVITFNSQWLV